MNVVELNPGEIKLDFTEHLKGKIMLVKILYCQHFHFHCKWCLLQNRGEKYNNLKSRKQCAKLNTRRQT